MSQEFNGSEVAVVGMAGRFPGARNLEQLWCNLRDGVESVRYLSDEELEDLGVDPALRNDPQWVKAVAQLDGYADFDAAFFGITPREAETMDPQHRVFLECAWEALENAGYDPERNSGLIGVFAGATLSTYLLLHLARNQQVVSSTDPLQLIIGNAGDSLTTRVSYKLNLKGPSHSLQCACSTSLVAVHLACQSLLNEECDVALAGGVSINLSQSAGYRFVEGSIVSLDGHCRPFDARAAGTVFGSGAGVVVLKRLEEALADGDSVRAVILGSAVNNDGSLKVGYTAPGVEGQARVITEALAVAGVDPETISYVEAHGTGTALGDPVEIQALTRAFRTYTDKTGFCALGSVKSNFGHLDIAAGVASLIKTVLALEHGQIPPSLHFVEPNPKIDFAGAPVYVNASLTDWKPDSHPRRAGVSSFGIGGTNAHVVLEQAPAAEVTGDSRPWQLLALSARSDSALEAATRALGEHLRQHPDLDLEDVAYTLHVGRRAFDQRRILTCSDLEDAATCLETLDPTRVFTASEVPETRDRPVSFLFSGQGAQYVGMGAELYESEPVFRDQVDHCSQLLLPRLERDLRRILYPAAGKRREAARQLGETWLTQPALFVVEYALAKLWNVWGVRPQAMMGHSLGEYVAACLAGVFSLEEALALVVERGRLMHTAPAGAMLSVSLPEAELVPLFGEDLSLAALNAPALCAVSGTPAAVEALHQELVARGVECRRLHVGVATHSRLMDPVVEPFVEEVAKVRLKPPQIRYVSNLTGTRIRDEEATDPAYWGRHLRQPVRFAAGLDELLQTAGAFLEVGPGRTLVTLAGQHPAATDRLILPSMRHPRDHGSDVAFLIRQVGKLWLAGARLDWEGFYAGRRRRRVPLPSYPFERQRYWVEGGDSVAPAGLPAAAPAPSPSPERPERPAAAVVARPKLRRGYVEPRNQIEREVARIWQEVLGVEKVGGDDNFFELDGHSLLATRVASRLRETFQLELTVERVLEQPTVAGMAGAVADALLSERRGAAQPVEREKLGEAEITRRPAELSRIPLSFAQERMWFLDQLDPGTNAFNTFYAVRFNGSLEVARLASCFHEIQRRHEVLRTTFAVVKGKPVQIIGEAAEVPLPMVDFGALDESRREQECRHLAVAEHQRSFDLERGPVVRLVLIRLGTRQHVVLLNMHHVATDGWSLGVLMGEVAALYEAFSRGAASPLPELPIQYADYAVWQRQRLQGEVLDAYLAYWQGQLALSPPPLRLTSDRPRTAGQSYRSEQRIRLLPPTLLAALREVGNREGATLFMTLFAAYQTLLHRYTGETDMLVGSPIANRNRVEIEELIGFFLNTLVLRSRPAPRSSFRTLLDQVRRTALEAYAYQDLPLEILLDALHLERDAGLTSLFQVMFLLENVPPARLEVAGLTLELMAEVSGSVDLGVNVFELCLTTEELPEGLVAAVAYNAELFDAATMVRFLGHFQNLVESLVADPGRRLEELCLIGEAERHQLLAWNDTRGQIRRESSIHQLIELQVERTPEATAVASAQGELSYRELNGRANQLAHHLGTLGVGPEVPVGLVLERSPEMIVGVLGVLKAGGAYVPIDPAYPAERTQLILDDVEAPVVLTSERLAAGLPANRAAVVCLDSDWETVTLQSAENPGRPVGSRHAAYAIYTSGSTGKPKGVLVEHRALVNFTEAARSAYPIGPDDRVLQFASISFDTSAEEIFPALTCGAAVVLRTDSMLGSAAALRDECRAWGVTVLDLPTAYWHELTAGLEAEGLELGPPLRLVILGGERPLPDRLATFMRHLDRRVRVLNTYGPTEATIVSTFSELARSFPQQYPGREAPIGRPLPDVRAYVVDPRLELAPIGVPGELVIGGEGLARGYLRRPQPTAERFVPDPLSGDPRNGDSSGDSSGDGAGMRLYRTGDRVRWRADGKLEFLGRLDFQVKIRGFRVELGEIEATLADHPAVREAAVLARGDLAGESALVAYFAATEEAPPISDLRAFLQARLPEYMVPAAFVSLEGLPRTPAGKLDRRALPAPDRERPELEDGYVAPRNPAEEALSEIFAELLEIERVGVNDSFFDLGGHSLLLPQVLYQVRETFQVEVPVRLFYEEPTVAGLAEVVEELILDQIEDLDAEA
ncbi:MAG: amino acid adenylation domain-containing protein [bacterium]|nr:amino acid adenylation domain-containing protein [bacterium]